jgi:polyhydroxyalkanoate synthesis regulator phasin
MTDNTNTPATPNELLSENHDLLYKLLAVIENHVNELVERKVNAIFQSYATMTLIDEQTVERIEEIVKDRMDEHEGDYDHPSNDDVSDLVATHVAHTDWGDTLRRSVEEIISDGDYPTEERVQEMMDDIDLEEKVKDVLRNI